MERQDLENLIFGTQDSKRYTQDSPVLPDVWLRYGENPLEPQDLLLTPHWGASPGKLALQLRGAIREDRKANRTRAKKLRPARVAYTNSTVAVEASFEELIRVILPLTQWWKDYLWRDRGLPQWADMRAELISLLRPMAAAREAARDEAAREAWITPDLAHRQTLAPDLVWMAGVVGTIACQLDRIESPEGPSSCRYSPEQLVDACDGILKRAAGWPDPDQPPQIWLVNLNRSSQLAVAKSALAIKADAARLLFDVQCRRLRWAILDCGIDAMHPAFLKPPTEQNSDESPWAERTRVRATYDFTRVRALLNPDNLTPANPMLPEALRRIIRENGPQAEQTKTQLRDLRRHLSQGRELDWQLLAPLLRIEHDPDYPTTGIPLLDHGTHVAGILGGDWAEESFRGLCPDIELYDFRVLDRRGKGDEFSLISALQFIRHLNTGKDYFEIHGANLSLSIRHDVANYACGRTPVCEECERLVSAGVVVVAVAGNAGYLRYSVPGGAQEGYHTVSIADPGNAENVITVGATHRSSPHTYGVSYFSGRGPTGDGRAKPDLVAPGEKITATVPNGGLARKDGTSMAAPHVSAAAAMLMARNEELIGQPARIKQILCQTATDLGRETYFQGAGMLDILRALQAM